MIDHLADTDEKWEQLYLYVKQSTNYSVSEIDRMDIAAFFRLLDTLKKAHDKQQKQQKQKR